MPVGFTSKQIHSRIMSEYRFELLSPDRMTDLYELYRNSFDDYVTLDTLRKKYDTSCFGLAFTGFLAYDSAGMPAAYYGVFPVLLDYKGTTILAAQSGDTMTHKDHRGKGLFVQLAKKTYGFARDNGVKIVFGFPNKNSFHGFFNKLDWIHQPDLNIYEFRVATIPLSRAANKLRFLKPLYNLYSGFFLNRSRSDKRYIRSSVIDDDTGGVKRDEKFFNYKSYFKHYILQLCGGKNLWVKLDGILWIGDIEKCTNEELRCILKKLKRLARWLGADKIVFHVSPGTYFDTMLSKDYTPRDKAPAGFVDFGSGIDPQKIKYTSADFDTF